MKAVLRRRRWGGRGRAPGDRAAAGELARAEAAAIRAAIGEALGEVSAQDVQGWFRLGGYRQ